MKTRTPPLTFEVVPTPALLKPMIRICGPQRSFLLLATGDPDDVLAGGDHLVGLEHDLATRRLGRLLAGLRGSIS